MIVIRLWGGLGNQMFQYAFGFRMAKERNEELILDTRFFSEEFLEHNHRFTRQKPDILKFPLTYISTAMTEEIPRSVSFYQHKIVNRMIRVLPFSSFPMGEFKYIKEWPLKYSEKYMDIDGHNIYFDGYWQCARYFDMCRNDLLSQFTRMHGTQAYQKVYDDVSSCNSIAVHIRRGDYCAHNNSFSNLYMLEKEYYDQTMSEATNQLRKPEFYFFSNDIEWVKVNFGERDNYHYISGAYDLTALDEMLLMSKCKHQIIANSTFSWWAAWLNTNKDKIVWVPDRWFGNKDIIPYGWRKKQIIMSHLDDC